MGEKVLDVENALDVVLRVLIDGDSAVVVGYDACKHILERGLYVEVNDVDSARHDFLCHLPTKTDDALQHVALFRNVLLVGQFHRLFQVVNSQQVFIVICKALGDDFAANEEFAQGPEDFAEDLKFRSGKTAESQGMLRTVDFGNDFAKEQEQEGEQNRHHKELEPLCLSEVDGFVEAEVEDDDDGHIHQIVADEDGCEEPFAIVQELGHLLVRGMFFFVYGTSVVGCQAEESNLACRDKA